MVTLYQKALQEYNKGSPEWCTPRRGTKEYLEVKKIEEKLRNKDKPKPKKSVKKIKKTVKPTVKPTVKVEVTVKPTVKPKKEKTVKPNKKIEEILEVAQELKEEQNGKLSDKQLDKIAELVKEQSSEKPKEDKKGLPIHAIINNMFKRFADTEKWELTEEEKEEVFKNKKSKEDFIEAFKNRFSSVYNDELSEAPNEEEYDDEDEYDAELNEYLADLTDKYGVEAQDKEDVLTPENVSLKEVLPKAIYNKLKSAL